MEIPCVDIDLSSPLVQRNPYPTYAEMRKRFPVCRLRDGLVALTRGDDILYALQNPGVFSSKGIKSVSEAEWLDKACHRSMYLLSMDEDLHKAHHKQINREFVGEPITNLIPFMRDETNRLLDEIGSRKPFEFVEQFAYPYIKAIIGRLVVADDTQEINEIRRGIQIRERSTPCEPSPEFKASLESVLSEQNNYFEKLISARSACPKSDIATRLMAMRPNGAPLTTYELYSALDLFISAGFHTTAQTLASAMLYLSRLDDVFHLLKAHPDRIPDFIEELLRIDGPTHRLLRTVTEPVTIRGFEIKPNELCSIIVSSANHDPQFFPNPDSFDIDRPNKKRHFEFGHGTHVCIGATLARTEIRIALEQILERSNNIRCLIDSDIEWISTVTTRGIRALRVQLS